MTTTTIHLQANDRQLAMRLDLDPAADAGIIAALNSNAFYEPDVAHTLMRALQEGDLALNVGANIGFFTAMMATLVGPQGRVICFEPAADNLVRLRHNIAVGGLTNVTVVTQPASDVAGPIRFFLNSDGGGGHALWDPGEYPLNVRSHLARRAVEMEATTLDAEIARLGLPVPKLIKIDTEGAEHRVLLGATGLLTMHKVPYIVAELHDFGLERLGSSQRELRRFMAGFGYETFCLYYDGSLPKHIPPDTALNARHFINLLFSSVEDVGRLWPIEWFDSLATRPAET